MLRWKSSLKPAAAAPSDNNPGTANLVGDWSMDETSGTRVDSHSSNDLTDNNTVGSTTGVISNAASLVSANSEYLSSTTVPVTGTGARSLEVWFKTSTSGTMHIVGFGGSSTSTNGAAFRLSIENGSLFCRVYGGYAGFGGSWNDGAWHQVVLKVMDSGYVEDLEMYVDGSSQTRVSGSNLTLTAINTGTDSFFVGQNIQSSATQYFNGDVDILRVFNDELTADEITWLYNSGSGRSYSDISGATDYRSTIIADNPVAYYRLGEASGPTASDEMGSSNGTYGSDTTYGVTGALDGDSNTSVSFAGSSTTNAAVQVSSLASANFSSGITIELWLKWNSSTGTGMPVEVREGNDGQDRIFFDARSSGTPHWDFNIAGTWYSATGAGVEDGWHLYAFTHDGTNAKTYRDGVLQNTTSASATTFNPDSMGIGQDGNGSNVIVGGVDEVAVYNAALSATELLAHYTAGAGAYRGTVLADNPLFYYRLGESSGATTAYDEVAQAANGTYYNTPDLGETGAISGDSNTAVKFNEANGEYAETVTLTSETSLLPCTIECFLKTDGASDSNAGIVFIRGSTPASGLNMYGSSTSVRRLGYHWDDAGQTYGFDDGPTFADDTWYYVALVIESTKATFYMIDESGTTNTATKTLTHSAINVSSDEWTLARDPLSAGRSFNGTIDEVAIYDQALSQSTIEAHAAAAGFSS